MSRMDSAWRRTGVRKLCVVVALVALALASCWLMGVGNWSAQVDAAASNEFWEEVANAPAVTGRANLSTQRPGRTWRLNEAAWRAVLRRVPHEQAATLSQSQSLISLPLPDGTFARFRLEASPVLEPALAARFPDIQSYRGQGVDDLALSVRLAWSPRGLFALVLTPAGAISIAPVRPEDVTVYASSDGQDIVAPTDLECLAEQLPHSTHKQFARLAPQAFALGHVRREFRIAIATTVEYTNAPNLGGGSVASALASVNNWLNALNAIYERDLAVHFNLAANNDRVIFATEDNFTNGNPSALLTEVRSVLAQTLGAANYDLGHVLGTGNGGTANMGVVCVDSGSPGPFKGGGVTLFGANATVGHPYYLTRLAHEIAHQFGATHSFNDDDANTSCGSGRNSISAWEPGSGVTIMSFAGSCNPIATGRALYFHGGTLAQIAAFLQSGAICARTVNKGNAAPVVNAGADFRIPRQTPFALTATASDPDVYDNANLSYAWEEMDSGGAIYGSAWFTDEQDGPGTTRPLFRSYAPASNPARLFPSLDFILNYANKPPLTRNENGAEVYVAESLPNVARALNFKVTVRDGRGGVADDDVLIDVDGASGPFAVTAPNTPLSWPAGSTQTITWSVNGTNAGVINATQVRLTLSLDGGRTFPVTLLTATPNDGSETITVPGFITDAARVRVEAIGNIFFDISDSNFAITSGAAACPTVTSLNPPRGQAGVSVTLNGTNLAGVSAVQFANGVNAPFTILSNTQIRTNVPAGAVTGPLKLVRSDCGEAQSLSFTVGACNFNLNATTRNVAAAANNSNVAVTATTGCTWSAVSNASWVTITSNANGTGNATVNFSIAANTGPARTGTLIVAGQLVTINQAAGCAFRLGSTTLAANGAGMNGQVTVQTSDGCPWTAVSNDIWLKLNTGSSYTGTQTVGFTVQPNGPNTRTGTLTIAGQTFTVTQGTFCNFTVTTANRSFAATTGSGVISVSASASSCPWTAQSQANWITVTGGTNSTGDNFVTFNVAANPGVARTSTVTVAGQPVTINQAAGCSFALNRPSQNFGANGGNGTAVNVTAGAGCTWTSSSPVNWVTLTGGTAGTGNGTVNFTVAANTGAARSAVLTLAGRPYVVAQAGTCTVSLNPTTRTVAAVAGTNTLNVTAGSSCAWTAVSQANWLTINTGASGTGNGTMSYNVAANPGGARTGLLVIGGVAHTVTQSAAGCSFALNPGNQSSAGAGGTGTVNVSAASHCAWTATSDAPWLLLEGPTAGTGNGTLGFRTTANFAAERTGTLTIGGQGFSVTQAAGCEFQLNVNQLRAVAAGDSLSATVSALTPCVWTATSNAPWLQVISGAPASGNGTLRFEALSNPGAARTGTLTVAGQTLTVRQAAETGLPGAALTALNPPFVNAGSTAFELTVSGLYFSSRAVINWKGRDLPTSFVNATQLKAQIPAAEVVNDGGVSVRVFDPVTLSATNTLTFYVAGAAAAVSAASFGQADFAPEQIVALFGQQLASATVQATALPLPTTLAGTTVRVRDSAGSERPASLFFVSAQQINFLLPAGLASGTATVTVVGSDNRAAITTLSVNPVAPGLFSADATGRGWPAGIALRVTGTQQRFEALSRFDTATRTYLPVPLDLGPATDQVFLVLYGTGWRQRTSLNTVFCSVGGVNVPVAFAGSQGGLAGLDQLNLGPLPRTLAGRGEVEVLVTVDGKNANPVRVQIK